MLRPLKTLSWNTQYGGREDPNGAPEERWEEQIKVIAENVPDVVSLQEMKDLEAHSGLRGTWEARLADLGLPMRLLVAPSKAGLHTVLGYNPEVMRRVHWDDRWAHETATGFGVATVTGTGADSPIPDGMHLGLVSVHLCAYSRVKALQEAEFIIGRLRRRGTGHGILAGDVNYPPIGGPEPDWAAVQPHNRLNRCKPRKSPDDPWESDLSVAERLHAGELVDVALECSRLNGDDPAYLAATGKGGLRVDQIHVTESLRDTIRSYRRLTSHASDHNPIIAEFDLAEAGPGVEFV